MICKLCWVSGRVQGVYYRGAAAGRARELGIHGYARNLPDGRVEVLAYGESGPCRRSWSGCGSARAPRA